MTSIEEHEVSQVSSGVPSETTPLQSKHVYNCTLGRIFSAFGMMRMKTFSRGPQEEYIPLSDDAEGGDSKSFLFKPYFNLTVCIVASALLSMPYGFDKTGVLGGMFMLTVVGLLIDYTLVLLGTVCVSCNIYDYQQLAELSFGTIGRMIQACVQLGMSLSLMISYQIIAAENLVRLLKTEWVGFIEGGGANYRMVLVLVLTLLILTPLATTVTLKVLGYSSMLSVMAIIVLALSLLYFDIAVSSRHSVELYNEEAMIGISVFATGFVCHQIITPCLGDIPAGPSRLIQFNKIVHAAVATSYAVFAVVGIGGYYLCFSSFSSGCPGNILEWRELNGSIVGSTAISMFLMTALFAYPIEHYSCFNTVIKLISRYYGDDLSLYWIVGIKLTLITITTIPAIVILDIGPLISWVGVLAAFPLGFILPLGLAIKNRAFESSKSWSFYLNILLLIFTGSLMAYELVEKCLSSYKS